MSDCKNVDYFCHVTSLIELPDFNRFIAVDLFSFHYLFIFLSEMFIFSSAMEINDY